MISPYQLTHLSDIPGFLVGGLLWALVVLPNRNIRPDRFLGRGLLSIYLGFLCLKFSRTLLLVAGDHKSDHFL